MGSAANGEYVAGELPEADGIDPADIEGSIIEARVGGQPETTPFAGAVHHGEHQSGSLQVAANGFLLHRNVLFTGHHSIIT